MSGKNNLNTSNTERTVPCDVTEQEAFDCYRRMQKPELAALANHFRQLGRNLSDSQLEEWARNDAWQSRLDLASGILVIDPDTILGELEKLAQGPTEKIM